MGEEADERKQRGGREEDGVVRCGGRVVGGHGGGQIRRVPGEWHQLAARAAR